MTIPRVVFIQKMTIPSNIHTEMTIPNDYYAKK